MSSRRILVPVLCLALLCCAAAASADEELDYGLDERRLRSLDIAGNDFFDDGRLKSLLELRAPAWYAPFRAPTYRRDRVEQGIVAIRALYRRSGFHTVTVDLVEVELSATRGDALRIEVTEGPRTLVDVLEFVGAEPLDPDELARRIRYREGGPAPARAADLGGDIYRILDAYLARGHLGARVREDLVATDSLVTLRYTIRPGPVYRIRQVDISGNARVREEHVRRELRMRPGNRFNTTSVARTETALLDTGWFRDVSFTPVDLDTLSAEATLALRVAERPTGFYEFGLGTGSKDRVRLTAAWGDRNVRSSGRGLTVRGRLLGVIDEDVTDASGNRLYVDHEEEILYRHPRLLGSRFTVNTSLFSRQESRPRTALELERLGLLTSTALFSGRLTRFELEAGIERTQKNPLIDEVEFDNSRAQTHSLTLVLERDSRDDIFRPRRGELRQILLRTAGGPLLRGDNSFHKALASYIRLQSLPGRTVFAFRAQAGWTEAWWHSKREAGPVRGVPIEDRFFAGGSSSVRGYRENSLGPRLQETEVAVQDPRFLLDRLSAGGNALLLVNAELRFPLPLFGRFGFDGTLFVDSGNVWNSWEDVSFDRFRLDGSVEGDAAAVAYRTSWGAGLQYRTVVGPLRLDYGVPLRRATYYQELEDGGREVADRDPEHVWHFSLGHAF